MHIRAVDQFNTQIDETMIDRRCVFQLDGLRDASVPPVVEAVCLSADEDVNEAKRRIESAVTRLASRGDVLVMTDMFGGTPADLALSLLEPGRIEVVTGVSLSMIVKFAAIRGTAPLAEIAGRVAEHGRKAIQVASALLGGDKNPTAQGGAP